MLNKYFFKEKEYQASQVRKAIKLGILSMKMMGVHGNQ